MRRHGVAGSHRHAHQRVQLGDDGCGCREESRSPCCARARTAGDDGRMPHEQLTRSLPPGAPRAPCVVIVGCGFGGLFAARALARARRWRCWSSTATTITSSSRCSTRSPPPRSPRRISRSRSARCCATRRTRSSCSPRRARVDLAAGRVKLGDNHLSYDYLILAPGAVDNYFGHAEWHRWAPGMKEVEDATFIRSRLLRSFEDCGD